MLPVTNSFTFDIVQSIDMGNNTYPAENCEHDSCDNKQGCYVTRHWASRLKLSFHSFPDIQLLVNIAAV